MALCTDEKQLTTGLWVKCLNLAQVAELFSLLHLWSRLNIWLPSDSHPCIMVSLVLHHRATKYLSPLKRIKGKKILYVELLYAGNLSVWAFVMDWLYLDLSPSSSHFFLADVLLILCCYSSVWIPHCSTLLFSCAGHLVRETFTYGSSIEPYSLYTLQSERNDPCTSFLDNALFFGKEWIEQLI